jgi:hypothetical protein
MDRSRAWTAVGALALALTLPAIAFASKTFFTAQVGSQTVIGFELKQGQKSKIVDFSWDGLKCGSDSFTAGLADAITVKSDRSFKSKQQVAGAAEGVEILANLKGAVAKDASKVTGTLKLTGDCESGKVDFTAKPD